MTFDVRRVGTGDLPAFIETLSTAFLERPDVAAVAAEVATLWELDRTWAAFERDRVVGTTRSWGTEITTPGGARLPASALAAVTVLPTHRRRGILRAMIDAEHHAARERGEAVGLLYASEYPIYGRFGYGPGCRDATWTLDVDRTGFHGTPAESVEVVAPDPENRDTIAGVFERWRMRQAGEIQRRDYRWDFDLGLRDSPWEPRWKGFLAVHRDATGVVDGYVRYKAEEKWEDRQPRNVLVVRDLHALTDDAGAALWRFLADVDLVSTVRAGGRSPSDRLPWLLTNARAAVVSEVGDGMWVRLFDIARALESRSYERAGAVVVEVIDREASGGRTRIALDATSDGARARSTDRSPDLALDVAALGAAWLGGTPLRNAVLASGVDEHRDGALAQLDALLRTPEEPWCSTFF